MKNHETTPHSTMSSGSLIAVPSRALDRTSQLYLTIAPRFSETLTLQLKMPNPQIKLLNPKPPIHSEIYIFF